MTDPFRAHRSAARPTALVTGARRAVSAVSKGAGIG